jgi:hypothetical protein
MSLLLTLATGACAGAPHEPHEPNGCPNGTGCEPDRPSTPLPAAPSPVAYRADDLAEVSAGGGAARPPRCSVVVSGHDVGQAVRAAADRELAAWLRQCALDAGIAKADVSVQFAAGPGGCVDEVSIRAQPDDPQLARCVAAGFHALRLPVEPGGAGTALRFPLRITSATR